MGRRDDDKPSWRDIDRARDRSRHTDQNRDPYRGGGGRSNRYYKAKLEKLMKDKLEQVFSDPERDGLARRIRDELLGAERLEAVRQYLDTYGLPEDFETLLAMAEVKDDEVFAAVVPAMAALWDEQPDSRRKVAVQTLKTRLMRLRDRDARAVASGLIGKG